MPNLAALFPLPPAEAVAYMQARGLLSPTFSWQDIYAGEHAHQFTVAKLSRLDLLDAIYRECKKNAAEGQSLRDFAKTLRPLLEKEGWWGKREVVDPKTGELGATVFDPARLKLIYDVNLRTAHMAGAWERIERNKITHPYIRYVTRRDERVRASHAAWDNLTLPVDHPFWLTHTPPNGWRCRCRITSMTQAEYDAGLAPNGKQLVTNAPEIVMVDWKDRLGNIRQIPAGIDPGWDYNPGLAAARARNLAQVTQEKLAAAAAPIREAARPSLPLSNSLPEGERAIVPSPASGGGLGRGLAGFGDNGGMKNIVRHYAGESELAAFYQSAIDNRERDRKLLLSRFTNSDALNQSLGKMADVDEIVLQSSYLAHAHDYHGAGGIRQDRYPVTAADLARLADIINGDAAPENKGKVTHTGNPLIRFVATIEGITYKVIGEIREGKRNRNIAVYNFYKR